MKLITLTLSILLLAACSSVPEAVKEDGREAAERAKQKAEGAYRDLEKEMK